MTTELLQRLEPEREGSRELDTEIALAISGNGPGNVWADDEPGYIYFAGYGSVNGHRERVPRFTTSLDAKLPWEDDLHWCIFSPNPDGKWTVQATDDVSRGWLEASAATEPLARRIAALKVREAA